MRARFAHPALALATLTAALALLAAPALPAQAQQPAPDTPHPVYLPAVQGAADEWLLLAEEPLPPAETAVDEPAFVPDPDAAPADPAAEADRPGEADGSGDEPGARDGPPPLTECDGPCVSPASPDAPDLTATGSLLLTQDTAGVTSSAEPHDTFGEATAAGDFNSDGFLDLAIGVPYEDLGVDDDAGIVHILYGSLDGLDALHSVQFSQDTPGMLDACEDNDFFGAALAAGDFDADGYTDLAVGVPGEDVGGFDSAGAVHIIPGSPSGLTAVGDQLFTTSTAGVPGSPEASARFGETLAAGDFDGDGRSDLAVGSPYEDIGALADVGAVTILYGAPAGLTGAGSDLFTQASSGVPSTNEAGDWFGWALASGDFDGDGDDDLAIGAPTEDVFADNGAGAITILYGSPAGLTGAGAATFHQDSAGIPGGAEASDYFGFALAAGDFSGDGYDDLAVGVPLEDVGANNCGVVLAMDGSAAGLTSTGSVNISQNSMGVPGSESLDALFGYALAAADSDGNGADDLAVGVPGHDVGPISSAGAVVALYDAPGGLSGSGSQLFHLDSFGVAGAAHAGDNLGMRLAGGDFNGDWRADLAASVPYYDVGGDANAGAVLVLFAPRRYRAWEPVVLGQ